MASETDQQREAAEVVRQRGPWAVTGFIAAFATAWLFERAEHPGRDLTYALAFAAEILVAVVALVVLRSPVFSARRRVTIAAASVAVLAVLVASYHVAVGGELEVLELALLFLALGSMVTFPWGTRAQALVALVSAGAYGFAVLAGVRPQTPLGLNLSGFAFVLGFTVLGAHLGERTQRRLLRRDAELKRTNAELEQRSRLESEFLSTMSHELRTPLNVIIGYLDLLEDGAFGALALDQVDPVRRAGRSARVLFELITATLDLSRLDAGVFSLDLRPVDMRSVVTEIVLEARDLPMRPTVRIEWEVDPAVPPVETDARMLKLVLRNLVGNALKFTEEGTVSIRVRPRDGGVELSVVDTGVGIPLESQQKIFEPFHQVQAAREGGSVGVGLGLHIVRRLVTLLAGQVAVESAPGSGSAFRVWLPCQRERREEEASLTASDVEGARTTP